MIKSRLLLLCLCIVSVCSIGVFADSSFSGMSSQLVAEVIQSDPLLVGNLIFYNSTHLSYVVDYTMDVVRKGVLLDAYGVGGIPVWKKEDTVLSAFSKADGNLVSDVSKVDDSLYDMKYDLSSVSKYAVSDVMYFTFPLEVGDWHILNESVIIRVSNLSQGVFNQTIAGTQPAIGLIANATGLIRYLTFDTDINGSGIVDITGTENPTTVFTGGQSIIEANDGNYNCLENKCWHDDGTDSNEDAIHWNNPDDVNWDLNFTNNKDFTFLVWINTTTISSGGIFGQGNTVQCFYYSSTLRCQWNGNTSERDISSNVKVNEWQLIGSRMNSTHIEAIADVPTGSPAPRNSILLSSSRPFVVGYTYNDGGSQGGFLSGQMDNVMVFNRSLSDAEILTLNSTTHPIFNQQGDYTTIVNNLTSDGSGSSYNTANVTIKGTGNYSEQIRFYNWSTINNDLISWVHFDDANNDSFLSNGIVGQSVDATSSDNWDILTDVGKCREERCFHPNNKAMDTKVVLDNQLIYNSMTIIAWVYYNGTSTSPIHPVQIQNSSFNGQLFKLSMIQSTQVDCNLDGGFNRNYGYFATDELVMIGCVYNGTHLSAMQHGVVNPVPTAVSGVFGAKSVYIGNDQFSNNFYDGFIDNVMVFNRSLTSLEMLELNNSYPRWSSYFEPECFNVSNGDNGGRCVHSLDNGNEVNESYFQQRVNLYGNSTSTPVIEEINVTLFNSDGGGGSSPSEEYHVPVRVDDLVNHTVNSTLWQFNFTYTTGSTWAEVYHNGSLQENLSYPSNNFNISVNVSTSHQVSVYVGNATGKNSTVLEGENRIVQISYECSHESQCGLCEECTDGISCDNQESNEDLKSECSVETTCPQGYIYGNTTGLCGGSGSCDSTVIGYNVSEGNVCDGSGSFDVSPGETTSCSDSWKQCDSVNDCTYDTHYVGYVGDGTSTCTGTGSVENVANNNNAEGVNCIGTTLSSTGEFGGTQCNTDNVCGGNSWEYYGGKVCDGFGACDMQDDIQNVTEGNICVDATNYDSNPNSTHNCAVWDNCIIGNQTAEMYYVGYNSTGSCVDTDWNITGAVHDYTPYTINTNENVTTSTCSSDAPDTTDPACVVVSRVPSNIEANSTGHFEMIVNCTDESGINITKVGDHYRSFFTMTVDGNGGTPNHWQIFYPENNLAVSNGLIGQQVMRSTGRNESYWYEYLGIAELNNVYDYAVYDGEYNHFKIQSSDEQSAIFNISGPVEKLLFKQMYPLNIEAMESEVKKDYIVNKQDSLMLKFYNLEEIKGEENYSLIMFENIDYTGTPNKNLIKYYCNESYIQKTCNGNIEVGECDNKPQEDEDYCVYLDAILYNELDTKQYTVEQSSYVKTEVYGVNNGLLGGIQVTNISYIYYMSGTSSGNYLIRYANETSNTNVTFKNAKLAYYTENEGEEFTDLQGTPNIFVNTIKEGDQLQIGGCVYDLAETPNRFCDFAFVTDNIGIVDFPLTHPNIYAYYEGQVAIEENIGENTDLNGTYNGTMTIHVNIGIDANAIGNVTHNLTLRNTDGTWNYTINTSFNSIDDSDIRIYFNTSLVTDGNYTMNITAWSKIDKTDQKSYLTENNFTIFNAFECNINADCTECQYCEQNECINQQQGWDNRSECGIDRACENSYQYTNKTGNCDGAGSCEDYVIFNVTTGNVCHDPSGYDVSPNSTKYCSNDWEECIDGNQSAENFYVGYDGLGNNICVNTNWVSIETYTSYAPNTINVTENVTTCQTNATIQLDIYDAFQCDDAEYVQDSMTIGYDLYFNTGDFETITAQVDNVSFTACMLNVNGTYYNFTDDGSSYSIIVMDTEEYDIPYEIICHYNSTDICYRTNITIKYRNAYNVTFSLYYWSKNDTRSAELLENEFAYIGLKPMRSIANAPKWNTLGNMGIVGQEKRTYDETEAYWGEYNDGVAKITLYEPDNYTLFSMNVRNKVLYVGNEFYFPKLKDLDKVQLEVLEINGSYTNYDVLLNQYEKLWSYGIMNLIWMLFGFILWIMICGAVFYVTKSAPVTIGVALIGLLPILLRLLGVIW